MNNFFDSIDTLFHEYNSFLKRKINLKSNLDKIYEDFKKIEEREIKISDSKMVLENGKKKKKTAYQNFFTITRNELKEENSKIAFGELSKMISSKWKELSSVEKKKYNSISSVTKKEENNNYEDFFIEDAVSECESEPSDINIGCEDEFSEISEMEEEDDDSISFNFEED